MLGNRNDEDVSGNYSSYDEGMMKMSQAMIVAMGG